MDAVMKSTRHEGVLHKSRLGTGGIGVIEDLRHYLLERTL